MNKYKLPNGQVVEIPLADVEQFLADNEGAVLVTDDATDYTDETNQSNEIQDNTEDENEIDEEDETDNEEEDVLSEDENIEELFGTAGRARNVEDDEEEDDNEEEDDEEEDDEEEVVLDEDNDGVPDEIDVVDDNESFTNLLDVIDLNEDENISTSSSEQSGHGEDDEEDIPDDQIADSYVDADGNIKQMDWQYMKRNNMPGWRKKKREFNKTQTPKYIKENNLVYDEGLGYYVEPNYDNLKKLNLIDEDGVYTYRNWKSGQLATVTFNEDGEPNYDYMQILSEASVIEPKGEYIPRYWNKWKRKTEKGSWVSPIDGEQYESLDDMISTWMKYFNEKGIVFENQADFLTKLGVKSRTTSIPSKSMGSTAIDIHSIMGVVKGTDRKLFKQLEWLGEFKTHAENLRAREGDVEAWENVPDAKYVTDYYRRQELAPKKSSLRFLINGKTANMNSYKLDDAHWDDGGLYFRHEEYYTAVEEEKLEDFYEHINTRIDEFFDSKIGMIDNEGNDLTVADAREKVFNDIVKEVIEEGEFKGLSYEDIVSKKYKGQLKRLQNKYDKQAKEYEDKLRKSYNEKYSGTKKQYREEVEEKFSILAKRLENQLKRDLYKKYGYNYTQAQFNEEVVKAYETQTEGIWEELNNEFNTKYSGPEGSWETEVNQPYQKYSSELYQNLFGGVLEEIEGEINEYVQNDDRYKKWEEEVFFPKYGEWANNIWSEWTNDFEPDTDHWDKISDQSMVNSLPNIHAGLVQNGFGDMQWDDKVRILEMRLAQEFAQFKELGIYLDAETKREVTKEYYAYFYNNLNQQERMNELGNWEVGYSAFHMKGMAFELKQWTDENNLDLFVQTTRFDDSLVGDDSEFHSSHLNRSTAEKMIVSDAEYRQNFLNNLERFKISKMNPILEDMMIKRLQSDPKLQDLYKLLVKEKKDGTKKLKERKIINLDTKHLQFRDDIDKQIYERLIHPVILEYRKFTGMMEEEANDIINAPETAKDLGSRPFWKGLDSLKAHEYVPVLSGLVNLRDSRRLYKIANKDKSERNLLEDKFLTLASISNEMDGMVSNISWRYNAGQMFGHSIPFIGEFIITSPAYRAAFTTVRTATAKVLSKKLKESTITKAGKIILADGTEAVFRNNVAGSIGLIAGSFLGQNLTQPHRIADWTYKFMTDEYTWAMSIDADEALESLTLHAFSAADIEGQKIGLKSGDGFVKAGLKGFGMNGTEVFSERLGLYFATLGRRALNLLPGKTKGLRLGDDVFDSEFVSRLSLGWLCRKFGLKSTAEVTEWAAKNGGYNGFLGEFLEELVNHPMQNVITGQPLLKGIRLYEEEYGPDGKIMYVDKGWDVRTQKTTALSVLGGSVMFTGGGFMYTSLTGNSTTPSYEIDNKRFETFDAYMKHLEVMQKQGRLSDKTNISISLDYMATQVVNQFLKDNNIKNEVKNPNANKGIILADEVDIQNELTFEEGQQLQDFEKQITDLNNQIEETKNSVEAKEDKEGTTKKIQNLRGKIKGLVGQITTIKNKVQQKILERKHSKIHKETLKRVKKINDNQLDNRIQITEALNEDQATALYLEQQHGIREEGGRYYDIKSGQDITDKLGPDFATKLEQEIKENKNNHGYFVANNENEQREKVSKNEESILKINEEIEGLNKTILDSKSTKEAVKEAKKKKKEKEKEIKRLNKENKRHIKNITQDTMIVNVNPTITQEGGAVTGHEFLHFFLRKTLDNNPDLAVAVGRVFLTRLANLDPRLIQDSKYAQTLQEYQNMTEAEQAEEAMAVYLSGVIQGEIKWNESFWNKVGGIYRHVLGKMGARVEWKDARDVFNFIHDFHKNIERGKLSPGMIKTLEKGIKIRGEISAEVEDVRLEREQAEAEEKKEKAKLKKAAVKELVNRFGFNEVEANEIYDNIKEQVEQGQEGKKPLMTSKSVNSMSNSMDQHISPDLKTNQDFQNNEAAQVGVYNELFNNNTLDGYLMKMIMADQNLGGLGNETQQSALEKIKLRLWEKIMKEYKPTLDDETPRSLFSYIYGKAEQKGWGGIAAWSFLDIKSEYVEDILERAGTLEYTTSEGTQTIEIEDQISQDQIDFESRDILNEVIKEQNLKKNQPATTGNIQEEIKGDLVENKLNYSDKTKNTISETTDQVNYDLENKTYKDVKNDVLNQLNPKVKSKNQVDPTGAFYPIIESIAQNEYGVNPKSILAKPQNLTKPESESARTRIGEKMKDMGPKNFLNSILGPAQTVSGKATGLSPKILETFYKDTGVRLPNKKAWIPNIENMSNNEILESVGLNSDFTLMPHNRKFDGIVKGLITQEAVLAANQGIRIQAIKDIKSKFPDVTVEGAIELAGSSFVEVGIGKPKIMFSKSVSAENKQAYQENFPQFILDFNNSKTNKSDWKSVRDLAKTYFPFLSSTELRNVAKDFVKWHEQWEVIDKKKKKILQSGVKNKLTKQQELELQGLESPLAEFLYQQTEEAFLEKSLWDSFGAQAEILGYKDAKAIFNDKKRVETARQQIVSMINTQLQNGKSPKEILTWWLKYGQGMYATASKIGSGKFNIKLNKNTGLYEVVLNQKDPTGVGTNRNQVMNSVPDFINLISNIEGLDIKGLSRTQIIEKYDLDVTTLSDKSSSAMNEINKKGEEQVFNEREQQSLEAREFVDMITKHYINEINNGNLDYADLIMLGKMLASNMESPMRKAANLEWIGVGIENIDTKLLGEQAEYEHMIPVSEMIAKLLKDLVRNGKLENGFWDNYTVAIIPSAMNDILTRLGLRNTTRPGHKIGDPSFLRYYNALTLGEKGMVPIRSINPKNKGKVVGQTHIKIGNKLNEAIAKTQKLKHEAKQKIIFNSKSPKTKGMSTYDFDDTLAQTKSGIRVKLPNLDGKPKPKKKVVFLAGGAGSGKSNVVNKLGLEEMGFKIVNQDISLEWLKKNHGLPEDMRDLTKEQKSLLGKLGHQARGIAKRKMMKFKGQGNGVVVDGTGASLKQMEKLVAEFEAKGYDVSMVFVETSMDVALQRNAARKERSLLDFIVKKNHEAVMGNKKAFQGIFKNRFMEVNTDNLTQESPMPETLVAQMNDFVSGYENRRIDAEEFAQQGSELLEQGAEFDFSEFNEVKEGTPGPLLDSAKKRAEKYGTENIFILTARPAESATAIHEFLKDQGLNIPIENIVGLGNSTGQAKADWILEKISEGYNDLYFVDDAFGNVEAVQNVVNQVDVKSDIVQAKIKFSKSANNEFNDILERSSDIKSEEEITDLTARQRGRGKGIVQKLKRADFGFVPPSAEDFKGLLYSFLGTGEQGNKDMEFFKENLLKPFSEGIRTLNTVIQKMSNEYAELKKSSPDVKLRNKVPGTELTNDLAIRVYLWNKAEFDIPGLSSSEQSKLIDHVKSNPSLLAFAEGLSNITRQPDGIGAPSQFWMVENIGSTLNDLVKGDLRSTVLADWIQNKDIIFSKENLNKIEAIYGSSFREALENILHRMETGTNRTTGKDSVENSFLDWINGSVGAVMFLNMRSALLQTISIVNFLDFKDNNIFNASRAFANVPQFMNDFAMIFNSDMLKQRRSGLQIDVSASELTNAFEKGGKNPKAILQWLLQMGFTPTRLADSFAIAFGGASFYRTRLDRYIKEGMSEKDAKNQAWLDFQEVAEETQQSSRPDFISQQQAGILGRLILAWQNTPMQMTRIMKKSLSDLMNRRRMPGLSQKQSDMANVSRIIYYGTIQNIIFGSLQSGLAFLMFGDDDDEMIKDKATRVANGALDSILRGTGIYGAAVSTLKNTIIQWNKQRKKGYGRQEWDRVAIEAINLSPPIGSKLRKIMNSVKTYEYNEDIIKKMGVRLDNPAWSVAGNIIEATTNIPLARLINKANNLEEAITGNHQMWQRAALVMGWNKWDVGVIDQDLERFKIEVKEEKAAIKKKKREDEKIRKEKEEADRKKKEGIKTVRCSGTRSNGEPCKLTTETKEDSWKCMYHMDFEDGMDRDGDGLKEYQCTATTGSGNRCKNKTENTNKKCYAHQ